MYNSQYPSFSNLFVLLYDFYNVLFTGSICLTFYADDGMLLFNFNPLPQSIKVYACPLKAMLRWLFPLPIRSKGRNSVKLEVVFLLEEIRSALYFSAD